MRVGWNYGRGMCSHGWWRGRGVKRIHRGLDANQWTREIKTAISITDLDESVPEKERGDMRRRKGGMGMAEPDSAGRPRLGIEGRELEG